VPRSLSRLPFQSVPLRKIRPFAFFKFEQFAWALLQKCCSLGASEKLSAMEKILIGVILFFLAATLSFAQPARWTEQRANDWYAQQPWLVGSNYIPATAINELEMWQVETFDPQRIDLELGWAESIGLNIMRVFLHDLLWQQDAPSFQKRIDRFLSIASKHHIRILFVLFDSCWDPYPHLGKQREPRPGVHNSGWVQSPGAAALSDPKQLPRLEGYVKGVVGAFANDQRILGWDVWNEPGGTNEGSYEKQELSNKRDLVRAMLSRVFAWARDAGASQPLTSGLWSGDWAKPEKLDPIQKIQLEQSDVLSFHNYSKPTDFLKHVRELQNFHRPILCTEYMARPRGSTFQGILPIAKEHKVAAINWGLVAGKTQTWLPWDSWKKPYTDRQPKEWFHEIFRTDGKPYRQDEVDLIRKLTRSP
jgi:Cellulase (glycosyl hydrolase family 5)